MSTTAPTSIARVDYGCARPSRGRTDLPLDGGSRSGDVRATAPLAIFQFGSNRTPKTPGRGPARCGRHLERGAWRLVHPSARIASTGGHVARDDRGPLHSFDEMRAQPFWKRVPPWWWSVILMLGPTLRIATGRTGGWLLAIELGLFVACGGYVLVDIRRRLERRRSDGSAVAAASSRTGGLH